jgi:hypothetical protein
MVLPLCKSSVASINTVLAAAHLVTKITQF